MTERQTWTYAGRITVDGVENHTWTREIPGPVQAGYRIPVQAGYRIPVAEFWPKPKPIPVEPIYLGSVTLVERDGRYYAEHRNADGELTLTEDIGGLLAFNFRILGIEPPKR